MSNIVTIDQHICHEAQNQLAADLRRALEPIRDMSCVGTVIDLPGQKLCVHDALDLIETAVFKALQPRRENDARDAFIAKVDGLSEQVEEIRRQMQS